MNGAAPQLGPRSRGSGGAWELAVAGLAVFALGLAHRRLFSLGTRHRGFESGLERFLFLPEEGAPLIVIGVCTWLVLRRWRRVAALERRMGPWWLVAPLLLLGAALLAWSMHAAAYELQALALASSAAGLVLAYWGLPGLRVLWLPIVFLLFAIQLPAPVHVTLLWKLRIWTAEYAGWLLYLGGVPAFVAGDQIHRAAQSFQVIEGCSGLRSAETLSMLAVLLVDLFGRRGLHAAVLFGLAPLVAFALNGFRVVTLTLNPHSEIVAVHSFQGIAILLVGLLILYGVDGLLERAARSGASHGTRSAARPDSTRVRSRERAGLYVLVLVAAGSLALSFATPVWIEPRPRLATVEEVVERALGRWESTELDSDANFRGSTYFLQSTRRSYRLPDGSVDVFLGRADLRDRRTSILTPIVSVPGSGWTLRESSRVTLQPGSRVIDSSVFERDQKKVLTYSWLVGSRGFARETVRAFLSLDRSALHRSGVLLAVRLSTALGDDSPENRADAGRRLAFAYRKLDPELRRLTEDPALTASRRAPREGPSGIQTPARRTTRRSENTSLPCRGPSCGYGNRFP